MNATALEIARERQLDWLLAEVLGEPPRAAARRQGATTPWLAAAIFALAIGVAFAVSALREPDAPAPAQQPQEPTWHECHGVAQLADVPADVVNLKCFDFDDAALPQLARFADLQRLDLSGMDPDARGVSHTVPITDAGVDALAACTSLRWLSLHGCQSVEGRTLHELRVVPLLEHLDLSSTSVGSEAFVHFAKLPSLRSLLLSRVLAFHGRSLAELGKLPGLRRLELAGCATIAAKDALHLADLKELRHLDLTDCMGAFLGQTAALFDDVTDEEPPPPPVQDGKGVTDEVVAALRDLPLETLALSGCRQLTDAIGGPLRAMTQLRRLSLGELPETTAALLQALPRGLTALSLDGNAGYDAAGLRALATFPALTELGLAGIVQLDDELLRVVLDGKQLQVLRIGGNRAIVQRTGTGPESQSRLTGACAAALGEQRALRELDLSYTQFVDAPLLDALGALPALASLSLEGSRVPRGATRGLAASASLRELSFVWCRSLDLESVQALVGARPTRLDLLGTNLQDADLERLAPSFPGCAIRLAGGRWLHVPE